MDVSPHGDTAMKFLLAAALGLLVTVPAWAQSDPSDRYRRDQPQASQGQNDQEAQSPSDRNAGEIEDLRRNSMSAPNVKGDQVPDNPATGAAAPELGTQPQRPDSPSR